MPSAQDDTLDELTAALANRFATVKTELQVAGRQLVIHRPKNPDDLIFEDEFTRDERLPYWAELWPSAIVLAERLARERGDGRRLLELGCGVGLGSIIALECGFDVLATDYYTEALEFTRLNALANGQRPPATRLVDWRDFPNDLGRFDVVIASDVLYERANSPLVAAAFANTLKPSGLGVLTDPQRKVAALFPGACELFGLEIVATDHIPVTFGDAKPTIDLFELRLQSGAWVPETVRR